VRGGGGRVGGRIKERGGACGGGRGKGRRREEGREEANMIMKGGGQGWEGEWGGGGK